MTIIGSASVQIRALDKLFEADVKKAVEKIKDVTIKVTADFDDNGVTDKVKKLREEASAQTLTIRAEADTAKAEKDLKDLREEAASKTMTIRADADTAAADHDLTHLRDSHDGKKVTLDAQTTTSGASAQLSWISRDRTALIHPIVDPGSLATAKGILESLAGVNTLRTLKDMLKDVTQNFDTASIKALSMSSAVLSLVSSLGWAATEAFAAGEGIAQLVGFAAMVPTLFGAGATAVTALHLAWNNFGNAMSEDPKKAAKALALLPPAAQKAATETKKLWQEIKKPVQPAFWDGMGESLQKTVAAMKPALQAGLTETAKTLGVFTSNFLNSFKKIAENKSLDTMFKNLNKGIQEMARGIEPFTDALNKLMFAGSNYLPQMGKWLADLAVRFDNFISKAAANGDIERWIDNAKAAMEDLWRIGGATIGVFQGLTRAFNEAGAKGLDGLATSLEGVEKIVKGPVFQSQFADIFNGMLIAANLTNEAFATLFKTMGNASQVFGEVFALAGGVFKEIVDGISTIIGMDGFQVGLINALGGLRTGLNDLEPSFKNLGDIFGGLLDIASSIFTNIAPVINDATGLIKTVIDNLKNGFKDVIPVLMNFIDTLVTAFSGPIGEAARIIGDMATAFSNLPGPIQTAIMAFGLILALAPKINAAFKGMRDEMKKAADGSQDANPAFQWLNKVQTWAGDASKSMSNAFKDLRVGMTDSVNWGKAAASDLKAAGSMAGSDFVGGIKGAFGALGFVGGELGAAISKSFGQASEVIRKATGPMVFVAQQAWSDIRTSFVGTWNDSFGSVRDGFSNLGVSMQNFAANTKYYSQLAVKSVVDAFSNMGRTGQSTWQTLTSDARVAWLMVQDGAKSAFSNLAASTRPFTNAMTDVWSTVRDRTVYMEKRFADMGTFISNAGMDIGSGFRAVAEQAGQAGQYLVTATEPIRTTISNVATTAVDSVSKAVSTVREVGSAMATNLSANFAPVGAAFGAMGNSIRDGASNIRDHVTNISSGFGNIVRSTGPAVEAIGGVAKAIGSAGKAGLGLAVSGLMNVLGGPWGLALTVATTALSLFGQAQQDTQNRIENLSSTLDKQSGAITNQTVEAMAKTLSKKDTWMGFNTAAESTLDNVKKLSLDTEGFTRAIVGDPAAREKYVQWHENLTAAMRAGGAQLDDFRQKNNLTNLSLEDMAVYADRVNNEYEKYKKELSEAQQRIQDVATATGTNSTQAAILSANYDVLASKTSSASEKFSALKSNLDVLMKGQLSAQDASKNYYAQLDQGRTTLENLKASNNGMVSNLFEVGKGFDMTTSKGRDLHTALSTQRDSILQLGTAALDNALKSGKSVEDARKAAIDAMGPAIGTLKSDLEKLGFAPPQIQAITDALGLVPEKITTSLGIEGAEKARQEIALTQMAAAAYATGNYTAALAALPDDAKAAITETFNLGDAFAKGDYQAILKALDQTGPGRDAAVASIIASVGGDKEAFKAHLKALDETGPGVRSAVTNIGGVQGKTVSIVAEDKTSGTVDFIKRSIGGIERYVKVTVDTVYNNYAGKAGNAQLGHDGAILGSVTNTGSLLSGKFPMQRFANGGIEQHFAQIAPAGAMRLWAEPETGGEAYIPLALNKRARSKKILEEVAKIFGFGLFKMFADGGVDNPSPVASYTPRSADSGLAYSGPLVVVNPSAPLDEEKVGTIAAQRLVFALKNK